MADESSKIPEPISLENLILKRKKEQEELSRPKFLSKAEREKLIEEKNQILGKKKDSHAQQILLKRKSFFNTNSLDDDKNVKGINESSLTETERSLLKEKFLGIVDENRVKKPRRFMDKKFHFDWDASEDTSNLNLSVPMSSFKKSYADDLIVAKRTKFDERHWSEKTLSEMTDRDWRIFKEDYAINTSGGGMPHPIRKWNESGLPSELIHTIEKLGYSEPTPIQRQAIPLALESRDFIGVAETGSGKTASFILPMITEIMKLSKMTSEISGDGPYGLIIVPTRELANQIEVEAKKFMAPLGFKCMAIVGGHSIAEQSFNLRNGAEILIATPGRLRDCIDQHIIVLNQCKYVVLDEADRMIDMNFEEDLKYILDIIPRTIHATKYSVHMTMFSATMPVSVERLARTYLMKPATIQIGQTGTVADTIEQRIQMIREDEKTNLLVNILTNGDDKFNPPVIIFVNQKKTVDYLTKRLETYGLRVVSLHGGKGQDQRESAISLLRSGQKDYLVATDVAGRGIDIKNVSLVINYDMPKSIEDYVHRVGRTGRAGNTGTAISFITNEDSDLFSDLRVILQKSGKNVIPHEFLQHESSRPQKKEGDRNIT